MKIYTIERLNKFDYDFSVSITKHGCYADRDKALERARKEYERLCATYEDEMKEYSDPDEYEDVGAGALEIEEDSDRGYYSVAFGFEEDHEFHSIAVTEWDLEEDESYFGVVRWCEADVIGALIDEGYKGTDEQVGIITTELMNSHGFTGHMIESGWEYIDTSIFNHEKELNELEV